MQRSSALASHAMPSGSVGKVAGKIIPEKIIATEQELHKGWLESVRAEKRNMVK